MEKNIYKRYNSQSYAFLVLLFTLESRRNFYYYSLNNLIDISKIVLKPKIIINKILCIMP